MDEEHDMTRRALVLLLGTLACGDRDASPGPTAAGGREVIDVSASLEALLGSGVRIGAQVDPGSEAEAFLRIQDAQFTPDGRSIVVLDASPPFVRVFNRDGSLETAFVPRGGGPGEAEFPGALAVSSDRLLLLELGRASLLTLEGALIEDRAISFWPTAAARGCGDDFLAYGPGAYRDDDIVWLRSFRTLEETPASILQGASPAEVSAYRERATGGSSRLARAGGLAALHHDARDPPETLTLSCPGNRMSAVDTVPEFREPVAGSAQHVAGGAAVQLRRGTHQFTGTAILNRMPIVSASLIGESGTHFIPVDQAAPALYTRSRVALLDAQPGHGVLLEAYGPVPHIVVVDYDAFVRALGLETP